MSSKQPGTAPLRVSMCPDYGSETALGDADTGLGWPAERLQLPEELCTRLREWCEHFNTNYACDGGWRSIDAEAEHLREGQHLLRATRAAADGRFSGDPCFAA